MLVLTYVHPNDTLTEVRDCFRIIIVNYYKLKALTVLKWSSEHLVIPQ